MDDYKHEHKFFLFKTFVEYKASNIVDTVVAYEQAEFAILSCNCGEVIKRRIKSE